MCVLKSHKRRSQKIVGLSQKKTAVQIRKWKKRIPTKIKVFMENSEVELKSTFFIYKLLEV